MRRKCLYFQDAIPISSLLSRLNLLAAGNAVSRVSPEIISRSRSALDESKNTKSKLLCGAGIVDGVDARRAIESEQKEFL